VTGQHFLSAALALVLGRQSFYKNFQFPDSERKEINKNTARTKSSRGVLFTMI
jgi:hypothetical protein